MTSIQAERAAAAGTLAVALAAWVVMATATVSPFGLSWIVMTAAMMLPASVPFVMAFARAFAGSRAWPAGAGLLVAAYLAVWLVFGLAVFAIAGLVPASWPPQLVAAAVVVLCAVYFFLPLRRAGQAGCAELCRGFSPSPDVLRTALVCGCRYGLRCIACTGWVMVALFFVGMSDLRLMALAAAVVFVVKAEGWSAIASPG